MTHRHRAWHAWAWMIVGPLILLGLAAGLMNRRPIAIQQTAAGAEVSTRVQAVEGESHSENTP